MCLTLGLSDGSLGSDAGHAFLVGVLWKWGCTVLSVSCLEANDAVLPDF